MNFTDRVEILLAEDNPNEVEVILRGLKECIPADRVHVVWDGEEALEYIFARGRYSGREFLLYPRLILLDLKLPKVDGLEVLRSIKSDERTMHIPTVILTSSRLEKDVAASYKHGANSYVIKPVRLDHFIENVSGLCFYWLRLNEALLAVNREG